MNRILIILSIALSFSCFSQHYETAIGIKAGGHGGGFAGINLKHFVSNKNALEVTLGGSNRHIRADILYEWQNATGVAENLDWYIGIGGAAGSWSTSGGKHQRGLYILGSAVLGLDYTLPIVPINIAFDTGPYVGVINSKTFGWGGAFGIRYIIK